MTDSKIETKDLKFHSQKAIGFATFLGGPLAAGYMIRENYLSLDKPDEGKQALVIGVLSTVLLFAGIFLIPESILDKVPNSVIPIIYTAIIYGIVEKIHGPLLNQHKDNAYDFHSGWHAAGIGFVSLVIMLIGIFGYAFLAPDGEEYDLYNIEMTKFSDNEEASLAFYDHLDSKDDKALLLELQSSIIPKWKENIEIIKQSNSIANLPEELLEQNKLLLKYSKLRVQAFELFEKAIAEGYDSYNMELEQVHMDIDEAIQKLNTL